MNINCHATLSTTYIIQLFIAYKWTILNNDLNNIFEKKIGSIGKE